MNSKNDGQQTVVNHIYGFQFNGCQITNPTFQTIMPNDVSTDCPETKNNPAQEAEQNESGIIPASLRTTEAERVLERLRSAGIVDSRWQPVGLSNAEKGVLASLLADRLDIGCLWQTFGDLWRMKPETLRSAYNKGMEQKRTGEFLERVKRSL